MDVAETKQKKNNSHGFSFEVARLKNKAGKALEWEGALLLRYIAHLSRFTKNKIDGKPIVRVNLDHIKEQYPYLSRATIDRKLKSLESFGCLKIANLNQALGRPKYDRTRCYHAIPPRLLEMVEEELRYYDPALAKLLGVEAASIHSNFSYWIADQTKQGLDQVWRLKPAEVATRLPFKPHTIERAIAILKNERLIEPVPGMHFYYAPLTATKKAQIEKCEKAQDEIRTSQFETEKAQNETRKAQNETTIVVERIERELIDNSKGAPTARTVEKSTHGVNETDPKPMAEDKPIDAPATFESLLAECEALEVKYARQDQVFQQTLAKSVIAISERFFKEQTPETLRYWLSFNDGEALFQEIAPVFKEYYWSFAKNSKCDDETKRFCYCLSLQSIVGAYMVERRKMFGYRQCYLFYKLVIDLWKMVLRVDMDLEEMEYQDAQILREEENASPDEGREHTANLASADKARVFRNAIDRRNEAGWRAHDGEHKTNLIEVSKAALNLVQRLFKHNPQLTPAALLTALDACMRLFLSDTAPVILPRGEKPPQGQQWHARRGATSLLRFVTNLHIIIEQLDLGEECPVQLFLKDIKAMDLENEDLELAA